MKKYFFSLIFAVIFSIPAVACLNGETLKLENGITLYEDYEGFIPYGHSFGGDKELKEILLSLDKDYKETKKIEYLSDKGLILIILGKYQEAIDLYKGIEKLHPNRYSTASNIGTAYELIGNNPEALKWIKKGVQLNPSSHFGSEWIHVNILKAKIKGEKYITSQFLIDKDFGKDKIPKSDMDRRSLYDFRASLYYQLNERVSFVQPKDKIIAHLLFDLGNVSYLYGDKEDAMEDYKLAKKYGFNDPILDERMKLYSPKVIDNVERKVIREVKYQIKPTRRSQLMGMIISVFALIFSGLIVFIFRKKIFPMLK